MREDWIWIAPSVLIAYFQVKVIWGMLPDYNDKDTEVEGERGKKVFFLFFYLESFLKALAIIQWAIVMFPITSGIYLVNLRIIGYLLVIVGFIISVVALNQLGNNWTGMLGYRIKKNQVLVKNGIYKWIRHPIYLGMIMEITGYELIVNSWLVVPIFMLVFWYVKRHIKKEDNLLRQKYNNDFLNYKKKVKALVPFVF
jgi:protein-S-isoprenylcysteine O-methyltransferase